MECSDSMNVPFSFVHILDECRSLTGDLPDISNILSRAMAALQDRPVLFK